MKPLHLVFAGCAIFLIGMAAHWKWAPVPRVQIGCAKIQLSEVYQKEPLRGEIRCYTHPNNFKQSLTYGCANGIEAKPGKEDVLVCHPVNVAVSMEFILFEPTPKK